MNPTVCRMARLAPLSPKARAHRAACLRCQAADARSRMVHRELAAMEDEVVPAPRQLASSVVTRLGTQDAIDPRRPLVARLAARYAAAAGVGAATVAAVVTGILRRKSRAAG